MALAKLIDMPELPPIRKWQMTDFDDWIVERLIDRWQMDESFWRRKLASYTAMNGFWFVTNEHAVILAMNIPHAMTGKPVIWEVFGWARGSECKSGIYTALKGTMADIALRSLYRQLREWGHSMGATRFYTRVCNDMLPSEMKEMFGGAYYVIGAPCSFDR